MNAEGSDNWSYSKCVPWDSKKIKVKEEIKMRELSIKLAQSAME